MEKNLTTSGCDKKIKKKVYSEVLDLCSLDIFILKFVGKKAVRQESARWLV